MVWTPGSPTPGRGQALKPSKSPRGLAARGGRPQAETPALPGPTPPPGAPRQPLLRPCRPHGPLRPPASLPRTPAASSTYCLKPRPPPRPKLEENGRAPQKCHRVGAGVSTAAPSVSDFGNARTTPPRMPRGSTACRARPSGQCSSLPGEFGDRGGRAALAPCQLVGSQVRGSSRSAGHSLSHI